MSQKLTPDSAQKGFAVGRGLLAAAETLNFSMGESHSDPYSSSSQQLGGMGGLGGGDGQDHESQLPRRVGSHLSNTMKLFASLGLSPTDLDVLAQVPEENISVETLPHLIMQLKNRKVESNRHLAGDLPSHSPDTSYRGGRDDWGDMQGGRLDRSSGQSQNRASQGDFGYSSMQDVSTRGYDMLDYGGGGGGGGSSRDRQYSDLSTDHYRGLGMASTSTSDDLFMQRRMGTPSQGKIQDFLGVMPHMFPHVCSLCDFDVHSAMEWTQHTTGMRHTENRRVLLQLYPDWDPQMPSRRLSGSLSLDTKGRSDGLLGAAPSGSLRQRTGLTSNWGSDSGMGMAGKMPSYSVPPKIRSRVVVVKYDRKPMLSALFALANPFGTIRENLVLKNKAFLELQTHEEALAMANFYQKKPAILHGKDVQIYLSKELLVIEKSDRPERDNRNIKGANSQVVFFSNLPRETEKKMELLTISRRFGTVEKHLFLNDQAFVQMSNPEDAEMLVKYYTLHPLTISRRPVHLNICTKYKTLTVPPGKGGQGRQERDEVSLKSSNRAIARTSSRSQRSTSSKARESSAEKTEEPKHEDEEDVLAEGSGDEGEGVVEAHDDEEEAFGEDLAVEEANQTSKVEQAVNESPEPEATAECEDSAMEPAKDETREAESMEMPEEAHLEQDVQSEEPAEPELDQEDLTEELKDTDGRDDVEQGDADIDNVPEHSDEHEGPGESDFPENMDEFVTLDELAEEEEAERHDSKSRAKTSSGASRESGGLRVVNVVGFKRSYGYLDEILALAKPFGKVVRHLVLDVRPEAFLELSSEQEAKAMVRFYSGNVIPSVCGKTVKIYHSQTYPTIQSGRVIYIGHIPPFKTSDASLLKIAEPFGKIRRYFLNRSRNECFIEMDRGEDAEKFAEACKENPPKFQGKRLVVYVSRKYKQLKHGHRPPSSEPEEKRPLKRERSEEEVEAQISSSVKTVVRKEEEPPIKKAKEEKPTDKAESVSKEVDQEDKEPQDVSSDGVPEVKKEDPEKDSGDTAEAHNTESKSPENDESAATPTAPSVGVTEKSQETNVAPSIPAQPVKKPETNLATLGPYEPNVPVGVEFVKMGYYCRVCFLFYSNEDTAKKVHCSSQAHYDKLKKHLEKEKAKTQSDSGKN